MTLPGDRDEAEELARMLRVDHAGEHGAVRIYAGQLAIMPEGPAKEAVRRMARQEAEHLATFEKLLPEHRVRPSALSPLWHLAGFALGATSAALGSRAAMAVTVAVEDVIEEHYRGQIERLPEGPIRDTLARFRADEIAHRDEALMHDATSAPGFGVLSGAVKAGSRLAIWLATRI